MKKFYRPSLWSLIGSQFVRYLPMYLGAIACLGVLHYTQSHLPFMAKQMGDQFGSKSLQPLVVQLAWMALAIFIFRSGSRLLFFTPARWLEKNLRVEILKDLENAQPSRYRHHSPGDIFQILFMDMAQIRALIGFALLQVGNVIVALVILIPRLTAFSPHLLVAFIPLVLAVFVFAYIAYKHQPLFKKIQDTQGEVQSFLVESYNGKMTVKNYQSESSFSQLFRDLCKKEQRFFFRATKGPASSIPLIPLGVGATFCWGAHIIFNQGMEATSLIFFSGFVFLFLEPLMFVSWLGAVIVRSIGSWERIQDFVKDLQTESFYEQKLKKANPVEMQISSSKSFTCEIPFWGKQLLDIEFLVDKWTVFIGKTGVGKSWVLESVAAVARIKGYEVSYVGQEPYIYNDSVEKNIFLGREITADKKVVAWELAKIFSLEEIASKREDFFKLELGENGKRVSGGQAKRLALIRSIMGQASYIIWDDPFSSVDFILEKQIIHSLKEHPYMQDKTIILSSHRLSTVRFSDQVYLLDEKQGVVEAGESKNLLEGKTKTYEFFEKQIV